MSATIEKKKLLKVTIIKQLFHRSMPTVAVIATLIKKIIPLLKSAIGKPVTEEHIIEQSFVPATTGRRAIVFLPRAFLKKYRSTQLKLPFCIDNDASRIVLTETGLSAEMDGCSILRIGEQKRIPISNPGRNAGPISTTGLVVENIKEFPNHKNNFAMPEKN